MLAQKKSLLLLKCCVNTSNLCGFAGAGFTRHEDHSVVIYRLHNDVLHLCDWQTESKCTQVRHPARWRHLGDTVIQTARSGSVQFSPHSCHRKRRVLIHPGFWLDGPTCVLKLLGQFRPPDFKFYWPDGPLVSIQLTTINVQRFP